MACKNGCTGGAASMCHAVKGINDVTQYGKTATSSNSLEALNGFDLSLINMEEILTTHNDITNLFTSL